MRNVCLLTFCNELPSAFLQIIWQNDPPLFHLHGFVSVYFLHSYTQNAVAPFHVVSIFLFSRSLSSPGAFCLRDICLAQIDLVKPDLLQSTAFCLNIIPHIEHSILAYFKQFLPFSLTGKLSIHIDRYPLFRVPFKSIQIARHLLDTSIFRSICSACCFHTHIYLSLSCTAYSCHAWLYRFFS